MLRPKSNDVPDDEPLLASYRSRHPTQGDCVYDLFREQIELTVLSWRGRPKGRRRLPLAQFYDLYEENEADADHRSWKAWYAGVIAVSAAVVWLAWDRIHLMGIYAGVALMAIGIRFAPKARMQWALFPAIELKSRNSDLVIVKNDHPAGRDEEFQQFVAAVQRQIQACRTSRELEKQGRSNGPGRILDD